MTFDEQRTEEQKQLDAEVLERVKRGIELLDKEYGPDWPRLMQPTIEPRDAAYLVALAMAKHDDDSGATLVNIGTAKMPEGMRVESVGPHRFVAMRDLAHYGAYGRLRQEG